MHKPLIEQLSQGHGSGFQTGEIDPALLAASFGSVVSVAQPLPETDIPLVHAEEDFNSPVDTRAKRRPAPLSILTIASARLTSIKTRTPERQKQAMEMLGSILKPLEAVDEFLALLEDEHFHALDDRWEVIRAQGRELADSLPALEKELGEWQNFSNQAQEEKQQRRHDVEEAFETRKRISTWATAKEVAAADRKLEKSQAEARAAAEKAFEYKKALAVVEGKVASAHENLRLFKIELKRLEAELRGEPYFDSTLGLSTDPIAYRDRW